MAQMIPVTTREFHILYRLLSYPKKTISRAQLLDEFWGVETGTGLRAVDVCITKLRDKFSACGCALQFENVWEKIRVKSREGAGSTFTVELPGVQKNG